MELARTRGSYRRRTAGSAAPVALFFAVALSAQQTAEIRLTVSDSSGAPIEAAGRLEYTATGAVTSFQTAPDGSFHVRVPPGRYRLQLSRPGFATHASVLDAGPPDPIVRAITMTIGIAAQSVTVVSATPLAGIDRTLDEIPGPAQTASALDLRTSGALDLSDFLNRRLNGVYLNEVQSNPMQPDVNYRGYTASPLLGTPQGVSVYLDGVRLNQPFGDVVSWDLIPRLAISEVALIPGSNPLFGLNTLGGSIALRSKDGMSHPGGSLQISGGSFGRKMAEIERGGATRKGFHWYLASSLLFEDGWREASPSSVRQFFGRFGIQREKTSASLTLGYMNNALIGNGLQEPRFLDRDYTSAYTKPDLTANRSPMLNWMLRRNLSTSVFLSANAYFRHIRTQTLNGDLNEDSLDQSVYQPGAAERAALAAAGYTGVPAAGAAAANTPFPVWRCIGNALLRDEPAEKCNGLLNRNATQQRNYGVSSQVSWLSGINAGRSQLTVGAAYDGSSVGFRQSTELGYLNPDRSITGVGAFGDGVTGGEVDGEPYDTRVDLSGRIHNASVYATGTISMANRLHVTLSGRMNRTSIDNRDRIRPRAGPGSLTGMHHFIRFNPAAGATYLTRRGISFYGGYTEGNRAPTSIELGCADPAEPCKLPNAMAGDPPLDQVITHTIEAGIRGNSEQRIRWSAGWFRAVNRDDILFVASEQTGFGYFKNFDRTLRQGLEIDVRTRLGKLGLGGGYTLLDATFRSSEDVNGAGNSTNEEARRGQRGFDGGIAITPGNRIPLTPRHLAKMHAEWQATSRLSLYGSVNGVSRSFARGNENNLHQPDGIYYLGPGTSPGYAVAGMSGNCRITPRVEMFVQINNLFNRRYFTGAQLGATGFTDQRTFVARPFPSVNGEFPLRHATFFAPGAPRGAWLGLRIRL